MVVIGFKEPQNSPGMLFLGKKSSKEGADT